MNHYVQYGFQCPLQYVSRYTLVEEDTYRSKNSSFDKPFIQFFVSIYLITSCLHNYSSDLSNYFADETWNIYTNADKYRNVEVYSI